MRALVGCFESREDPRMVNKCRHKLLDILVIANVDSWDDMALVGESKGGWLRQWLKLPNWIPRQTRSSACSRIAMAKPFRSALRSGWRRSSAGQGIAIDDKTVRGTCDAQGQGGLPLVSAWAAANRLTQAHSRHD